MNRTNLIVPKGVKPSLLLRIYRVAAPFRRWMDKGLSLLTDELIGAAYESKPGAMRDVGQYLASRLRQGHKYWLVGIESEVVRLSGVGKEDGQPLTVLYLGDETSLKFLIFEMFEDESVERENLGRCLTKNMIQAASHLARNNDLVVFERPVGMKWNPPYGEWISTPRWVRMVMDITAGTSKEEMRSYLRTRQKKNIKKVMNAGIYPVSSKRPEDLQLFIDRFHKPTIRMRHGEYAGVPDQKHYLKLAKKGLILFHCLPDGTRIAGSLNMLRNKTFYAVYCGFLDGDNQWLDKGALAADYLYAFDYAVENGFRKVDCGEVMPILSNGLYNHKKRWGFHTEISPWHVTEWLFWIPGNSQSAWNWIHAHPIDAQFVSCGGEQMEGYYRRQEWADGVDHEILYA